MNDIILDGNGEPILSNGDFLVADDKQQRVMLLMETDKNDWKQWPVMGVGTDGYLEDENTGQLFREIREQMKLDGLTVTHLGIKQGVIELNVK